MSEYTWTSGAKATPYPSLNAASPVLYGGGGGAGGRHSYTSGGTAYGGAASLGTPGIIIIEKGVK